MAHVHLHHDFLVYTLESHIEIERSFIKSYKINKHSFPLKFRVEKSCTGPGGERVDGFQDSSSFFCSSFSRPFFHSSLAFDGWKHTSGSTFKPGPQYTQLTGTHWGSLHSLSTAACNVSKALSRLSLTMVRSK